MLKKQNEQVVSHLKASSILGDVNKDNLFIANKVISSRMCDNRSLVIGKRKDLVYRLSDDAYLTLTDANSLNSEFVARRRLNDLFDLEQYKRYVETNGVLTFAGTLDLDEDQEDFIYLADIQGFLEYGVDTHRMTYDELIDELKRINKFLKKYYDKNLHDSTIDKNTVEKNYVKTNNYGFEHIITSLNEDKLNNELSLIYSIKKHNM